MIILNDIHKWVPVDAKEGIVFHNRNPRPITLDFNVDGEASMYILVGDEKTPYFLGLVKGRQTLKFVTPDKFVLVNKTIDVNAYVLSRDSTKVHREVLDEEIFTTLHEPRAVDPDVQRMMDKINIGVQRRLAAQEAHYERMLAHERENSAAAAAAVAATGGDGDTGQAPVVQPSGGDGGEPPVAAS